MKEKHGNEYFQYLDLVLRCALQMDDVSELYISMYSDTSQLTYYWPKSPVFHDIVSPT